MVERAECGQLRGAYVIHGAHAHARFTDSQTAVGCGFASSVFTHLHGINDVLRSISYTRRLKKYGIELSCYLNFGVWEH